MNKLHSSYNKKIVQYAEDNIPKNIEIQEIPQLKKAREIPEEISISEQIIVTDPVVTIPRINSTSGLQKRLKQVEQIKPRKVKSLSDLPKPEKVTVDEKITKKINFPFDQRLYKELISLKLIERPVLQPVSNNYEQTTKDRVPNLEDFFVPTVPNECNITASVSLSPQTINNTYKGFRTYQLMRTWENF